MKRRTHIGIGITWYVLAHVLAALFIIKLSVHDVDVTLSATALMVATCISFVAAFTHALIGGVR
jgi:succinate dehydrogenase hydrophobic anchor subunit